MISECELEDAGYDAILVEYMRYGSTGARYDYLEYLLECAEMDAIFEADEEGLSESPY